MEGRNHGSALRRAKFVLALGVMLLAGAIASGAFGMVDPITGTTDSTPTETTTPAPTDTSPPASSTGTDSNTASTSTSSDSTTTSQTTTTAGSPIDPTISADKSDYSPGSVVTLRGAGWAADETVHLFVNDDKGQTWSYSADAHADAAGTFSAQVQLPPSFIATYSVTATGETSGTATTTFTDGNIVVQLATANNSASGVAGFTWSVNWTQWQGQGNSPNSNCSGSGTAHTTTYTVSTADAGGQNTTPQANNNASAQISGAQATGSFAAQQAFAYWTLAPTDGPSQAVTPGCVAGQNGTGTLATFYAHFRSAVQSTSLAVSSASGTYGGTASLSATLSAGGSAVSNKTVNFTLNGNAVGSATTNASGMATLNGASLAGNNAGTYGAGVGASFGGDSSFSSSTGTASLTIAKADQTLTFAQPTSPAAYGSAFAVNATASSGLPVALNVTGPCTYNGSLGTVTMTSGSGTCLITASQGGNGNYNATANTTRNVDAMKANQTITISSHAPATAAFNSSFGPVAATATSGLPVTFSSSGPCTNSSATFTMTSGSSACTVKYDQVGDSNYNAAPQVTETVNAAKATQTITFAQPATPAAYGATFPVNPTSDSSLGVQVAASGACSIAGGTVTMTSGTGSCTLTASQGGNANYAAATDVVRKAKATPTVSVSWSDSTFDGAAHAAAGSVSGVGGAALGSPDSFSYYSGSTASGSPLPGAPKDAGTYTVVAHFGGNGNYAAADSAAKTVTIAKAAVSVDLTWANSTYDGNPNPASAQVNGVDGETDLSPKATFEYFSGNDVSGTPLSGAPTDAGTYTVRASFAGNGNYDAAHADETVTIAKASASVTVTWADSTYDGDANPASAQVNGVAGETGLSPVASLEYFSGSTATGTPLAGTPKDAGTYSVVAHFDGNRNYAGADSAPKTITIAKAIPTVSVEWSGWTFDGTAHAATGSVSGVEDAKLGDPNSFSYYGGSDASGSPLGGVAPSNAGTYTVFAHFDGSSNYTAADSTAKTITVAKATPAVSVDWSGWTFDGSAHPASGSVSGVGGADLGSADSVSYYGGSDASGTPLAGAPKDAGTYTVVGHFGGNDNYTGADSAPKTITVDKADGSVDVTWADSTYDASSHPASAKVKGVAGETDLAPKAGFDYFSGSDTSGSALAGAPTNAGTYTVRASFAGNGNYNPAHAVQTITIAKASASVVVSWADSTFDASQHAASAQVDGVAGETDLSPKASFTYFGGSSASGSALAGAPVDAGTYTVRATFAGNGNYNDAYADQTITIAKATPNVSANWSGWTFDGTAHAATGSVSGVGGAGLKDADSFSYFSGLDASGTPLVGAPKDAGTYTVVAHFGGNGNYTGADSDPKTVTVAKATPAVSVDWSGWTFDATAHPASGSVSGVGGADLGLADSYAYYNGSAASGGPLAGAPKDAGAYTVVAHFGGSGNYAAADSAPKTVTVDKATPTVTASWSAWTFDGTVHSATGSVSGVGGAGVGTADSFTYYSGSTASGSPLAGAPSDAGTYTAVAHFNGSDNYKAADSAPTSVTVAKADQAITFPTIGGHVYLDPDFDAGASAGSGLAVSYWSGAADQCTIVNGKVHITGAGSCTVTAAQAGNANYNPAVAVSRSFAIAKANQTIMFNTLPAKTFGDDDFTVTATASSGLSVGFTVGASDNCTIAGGRVHISGAGSCTVTAHQVGDGNFNGASDVARTFAIAKRNTTVTAATTAAVTLGQSSLGVSAVVSASGGAAQPNAGTVSFSLKNGTGAIVATLSPAVSGGSVGGNLAIASLPVGTYTLLASYDGTPNFNGSNNSGQSPVTVSDQYRWDGFLQPINDTAHQVGLETSVFKAGSTVPAKLQLKRADGTVVQAGAPPVWLTPVKGGSMSSPVSETAYTDTPTAGSSFTWDGTQYQYNWSTKGLAAGYWYKICARFDDGQTQCVNIGLR